MTPQDNSSPPLLSDDAEPSIIRARRIITRARGEKTEADERHQQKRLETTRREALLAHLFSACNYGPPLGRMTDPSNWIDLLARMLKTAAPDVQGDILSQVSQHGEARQVLVCVCGLIQTGYIEGAVQTLGNALDSALKPALWEDLSRHFPEDVSHLLPAELREKFEKMRDRKPHGITVVAATNAPQPSPKDLLTRHQEAVAEASPPADEKGEGGEKTAQTEAWRPGRTASVGSSTARAGNNAE
jgi:hypothetical protein